MPRSAAPAAAERTAFLDDLASGLSRTPRQIPARYFYDDLGSALFEAICALPWYGLTRTESRLIEAHRREIVGVQTGITDIVELGPGNGRKLSALLAGLPAPGTAVHLVDVSSAALDAAAREVGPHARSVALYEADYETGLAAVAAARGPHRRPGRTLVLFLGSNIGNFHPREAADLLGRIRAGLDPGDAVLIGADLVKPERDLLLAYDDPLGVTAAFNRNLLVRANRELGATFDVQAFGHRATWNARASRIEMHLVCTRAHHVIVPDGPLETAFAVGDTIWTESSYKFSPAQIAGLIEAAGFITERQWTQSGFALTFARAVGPTGESDV